MTRATTSTMTATTMRAMLYFPMVDSLELTFGSRDHLRDYLKTSFYCDRLRSPESALSAENVLDVLGEHASEPFPPAALPPGFSLDLVTKHVLR